MVIDQNHFERVRWEERGCIRTDKDIAVHSAPNAAIVIDIDGVLSENLENHVHWMTSRICKPLLESGI